MDKLAHISDCEEFRKMVKKCIPILFLVLLSLVDCHRDGDTPIPVPGHPAFILNSGSGFNTITVLDLDKMEVIGYRKAVNGKNYIIEDFALSPDNHIFLPISWFMQPVSDGKCVLVDNIETDEILTDSIPTSLWPTYIYPFLDDTRAFIGHPGIILGDTDVVSTELDLVNRKVIKTFRYKGLLDNVLTFADGGTYLLYTQGWEPNKQFIRSFDASGDSMTGQPLEVGAPSALVCAVVVSDSEFAAPGNNGIAFFNRNTGKLMSEVALADSPDRCVVVKGKLYVCHNTGWLMKNGNFKKVSVIDLGTRSVIKTIEVCNAPVDIAYSKATNKIVVVSGVGTVITIIDPDGDSVTATIVSDEVGDVDDKLGYYRLRIPE